MQATDILALRLQNQQLTQSTMANPVALVRWLGAVQSQDFAAAKWSLGVRLPTTTDASIEESFNKGEILRTHVMRPTWHFVLPEDIGWMLALTAPRVLSFLKSYDRKLELTDDVLSHCFSIITKALEKEHFLTRSELAEQLESHKIAARGQRLGHIVGHAELAGLICSGPRRGKQFTYALLAERAPQAKKLSREESLATLAKRYFTSHGPAQIKDFAWWSGLTMKDAQAAREFVPSLVSEEVQEKTYWFVPPAKGVPSATHTAFVFSIFDEYTIAYKDRSVLSEERFVEKFITMGNALTGVMISEGRVIGTWKRSLHKESVTVNLFPLLPITTREQNAFVQIAERYRSFLEMSTVSVNFLG